MDPSTPRRGHKRGESSTSAATNTPPGGYVSAQEETPTRPGQSSSSNDGSSFSVTGPAPQDTPEQPSSSPLSHRDSQGTIRQSKIRQAHADLDTVTPARRFSRDRNPDNGDDETPLKTGISVGTMRASEVDTDDDVTPVPRRIEIANARLSYDFDADEEDADELDGPRHHRKGGRAHVSDNQRSGAVGSTSTPGPSKGQKRNNDLTSKLRLDFTSSSRYNHMSHSRGEGSGGSVASGSMSGSGSGFGSTPGSGPSSTGSGRSDSMLEVLDNESEAGDLGLDLDEEEGGDEGLGADVGDPLVSRGRRRRTKRWEEREDKAEKSLFELIPPLLLAHPLPLLPLLPSLPGNFLPAGVVFFIPIYCVLIALSACAHIVIVYLAWYLKVPSFEEVFSRVTGRFGRYGRYGGRGIVILSTVGLLVSWLGSLQPLLEPLVDSYLPNRSAFRSPLLWTILPAALLLPSLLPSRMTRSLRRAPVFLTLLLPVVIFLVIGRTSEINKAMQEERPLLDMANHMRKDLIDRTIGLEGKSSAGAGITTLAMFLSPHINTLPIHRSLPRNKRTSFPLPCLLTSIIILALTLPFALVPYYLLPGTTDPNSDTPSNPAHTASSPKTGVFSHLPVDDGWVNLARLLQCAISLGSCNMWILRSRDTILSSMGVESGERLKAGRWVGLALWVMITALACVGGWMSEKIEMIGIIATIGIAWFLPSLFFIITFHVRSPLSIIFPNHQKPPPTESSQPPTPMPRSGVSRSHSRADSLNDPSTDVLLARKERQLQKRRLGRRLWQDLIVYVGIMPVGVITLVWSVGALLGLW